jgi:hypothetical protein
VIYVYTVQRPESYRAGGRGAATSMAITWAKSSEPAFFAATRRLKRTYSRAFRRVWFSY